MELNIAFEVAKAFLEMEDFDNAKIEQDKNWNCSVVVQNDYLTQDSLEALHKIMRLFSKLDFIVEGDTEIRVFTLEGVDKKEVEVTE